MNSCRTKQTQTTCSRIDFVMSRSVCFGRIERERFLAETLENLLESESDTESKFRGRSPGSSEIRSPSSACGNSVRFQKNASEGDAPRQQQITGGSDIGRLTGGRRELPIPTRVRSGARKKVLEDATGPLCNDDKVQVGVCLTQV